MENKGQRRLNLVNFEQLKTSHTFLVETKMYEELFAALRA